MRRWGVLLILLWGAAASAADIQYMLSNGHVSAVRDDPPITGTPDEPVVTIPEAMSEIVWPVPTGQPANTSCGTGRQEWTRVSDPDNVTVSGGGMALRTGLLVFKTTSTLLPGCHLVSNWGKLRALVEATVAAEEPEGDLVLLSHQKWNRASELKCPGSSGGATCDSVRASMATLNAAYPDADALNTFLAQVVTLRADALTFKTAQGW